jgi:hypothetical protein
MSKGLGITGSAAREFDFGYVNGCVALATGYDGVVRGGSAQEQVFSFGSPEHNSKNRSFCSYLLVDFAALSDSQSPRACSSDPYGALVIGTYSVRLDVVLKLGPHAPVL